MPEIAHLQARAWVIVYSATGEPAHDEFYDDQERAGAVMAMLRMTTERDLEVRRALL